MTHYELLMFWTGQIVWMAVCAFLGFMLLDVIYYLLKGFVRACSWLKWTMTWARAENINIGRKELLMLIPRFFDYVLMLSDGREWTLTVMDGKHRWYGYGRWYVEYEKTER